MSNSPAPEQLVERLDWTVIKRLDGLFQGEYHTLFRGLGIDLADLREYAPPDDVRHIDWNVTARLQTPYVRIFHEDRELSAWFLIDESASVDTGWSTRTKREASIELAALLARLLTRRGNRVGAILFGGDRRRVIPEGGGKAHVLRIVRTAMASPRRSSDQTDLSSALAALSNIVSRRSALFILSDFVSKPGWVRPLGALARRHDIVAVRVVDPFEQSLPPVGIVPVVDAETGEQITVDTSSRRYQRAYQEEMEALDASIIEGFAEARVDALELSTEESLIDAVIRFARLRKAHTLARAADSPEVV
jgi:uncharacterized protein (DUF58 family)